MMELSDFYPSPDDLIKNELRALEHLSTSTYIAREHSQFFDDAKKCHKQYRYCQTGFKFASTLDVAHAEMPKAKKRSGTRWREAPNLKLLVAALIEKKNKSTYRNISYALAVFRIRSKGLSIVRKFHFDITCEGDSTSARRQQHPMCHLQYCGGMLPLMTEIGVRKTQLQNLQMKLSEPRIFYWPMSLALLTDMALHEFSFARSASFRETPEWQSIIRDNETLLLRPFYEKCVEVIVKNRTLAKEFYVA
jgi:hypothetical protein